MHARDLQKLTIWQGQEIGNIAQALDPGVDEISKCFVVNPAGEIAGVDVTVGDVSTDSFVKYPIVEIPGVDIEWGDAHLTGVDKDFDA